MSLLSTGQVAKALQVASRTVCKWIDQKLMVAHRLPGSFNRRVRLGDLVRFAREHQMPLTIPGYGQRFSILLVGMCQTLADAVQEQLVDCEFSLAETAYEAGQRTADHLPNVAVVDCSIGFAAAKELCKHLVADKIQVMVLLPEDGAEFPGEDVLVLRQPVGPEVVVNLLLQLQS